jgi:HEPN domain-containing protein
MQYDFRADSPLEWMRHARSDLAYAQMPLPAGGMLAVACFHAQQAIEKSIKAVLVYRQIRFPRTHALEALIDLLPDDISYPFDLRLTSIVSGYATGPRYPGEFEEITEEERIEAARLAEAVVSWADRVVGGQTSIF